MAHLRMNGAYYGLTTLDLLRKIDTMDANAVVPRIMACQHESGGVGCNLGHDPHVLYTLSVVQCLALFDKSNLLDIEKVTKFLCCVGALAITGYLDRVDKDLLGWWLLVKMSNCIDVFWSGFSTLISGVIFILSFFDLVGLGFLRSFLSRCLVGVYSQQWLCERQVKSGGLNGWPEKLPDVCYSWCVLSSLTMIYRVNWIDKEKLIDFILHCQDAEKGGISDRPDDALNIYHTYFGIARLSLLEYPGIKAIDPAYALLTDVVNRIFFG